MVFARLPHLFHAFSNNYYGNHGDNCASFQGSTEEERAVLGGTKPAFLSPPITAAGAHRVRKSTAALLRAGGVAVKGQ